MKKLSLLALVCCIAASSFATIPTHSLSDTGKMKAHKKHKMKKMKDTAAKM